MLNFPVFPNTGEYEVKIRLSHSPSRACWWDRWTKEQEVWNHTYKESYTKLFSIAKEPNLWTWKALNLNTSSQIYKK